MLTKTVLHRQGHDKYPCFFAQQSEDDYMREHAVALDVDAFEDLGSPDTIAVTIEPGDTLNA